MHIVYWVSSTLFSGICAAALDEKCVTAHFWPHLKNDFLVLFASGVALVLVLFPRNNSCNFQSSEFLYIAIHCTSDD